MSDRSPPPEAAPAETSPSHDLKAAAVHGLRWTSIGRVVVELALLASMVVIARLIPPEQFGPYAVAIVVQELALGIQSQGVGNALVQYPNADRRHRQAGQALALIGGLGLAVLTLLAAPLIAEPIFGSATASLVALSAPLCVVTGLSIVPTATLRRNLDFRRLTMMDMASNALRVASSIGLAAAGFGAKSLVFGSLAAGLVGMVMAWIASPPPFPVLRREPARELLGYGGPASLAAISWVCFRNCDYAIVGARLGTMQAGLYFRAYQLGVEYQKKVSDLMVTVAFPVLSRSSNEEQLRAMRGQVVRLLTMLLFPLLALLAIVAPVFIPWLLGPAWAPVVVPTQILAVGGATTLVMDTAGVALAAAGRSRAMLGFGVAHFLVYAVVVWVVAPLGINAVAIGAAVVHSAFVLVSYVVMLSPTPARTALGHVIADVAPAFVASLALAVLAVPATIALTGAGAPVLINVLATAAVGAVAYLLALRTVFPAAWRQLCTGVGHMLPMERLRRLIGRVVRRPSLAGARSVG